MNNNTTLVARIVHDLSLSSWFGGELMGAVGLNGAAASLSDPSQRSRAANAGWERFSPVLLGSVAAHLLSGVVLVKEDSSRLKSQPAFRRASAIKTVLTGAALAGTAYQSVLGRQMSAGGDQPVEGATQPGPFTDNKRAAAQRQLNVLQFLVPALTGSAWIVHSANGELTRPSEQAQGVLSQVTRVGAGVVRPALIAAAAAGVGSFALKSLRSRSSKSKNTQPVLPPTAAPVTGPTGTTPASTPPATPEVRVIHETIQDTPASTVDFDTTPGTGTGPTDVTGPSDPQRF